MNVDNPVFLASGELKSCLYCPLYDLPLSACFHFNGNGDCPTESTFQQAIEFAKEYENDI